MNKPLNCHLWTKPDVTIEDLRNSLEDIKTYEEDSHLLRTLKKCKTCGQLFFYEFFEEVDWVGGNDPQYLTWIPVENEKIGDELNTINGGELNKSPRIVQNWPSDAKDPPVPKKISGG